MDKLLQRVSKLAGIAIVALTVNSAEAKPAVSSADTTNISKSIPISPTDQRMSKEKEQMLLEVYIKYQSVVKNLKSIFALNNFESTLRQAGYKTDRGTFDAIYKFMTERGLTERIDLDTPDKLFAKVFGAIKEGALTLERL